MKILRTLRTGSRVICDPIPEGSDEDILILIDCNLDDLDVILIMEGLGFHYEGNRHYTDVGDKKPFQSWRRGRVNWVLTNDPRYFNLFRIATDLARRLNLLDKDDRIALFKAVLYGEEHNVHYVTLLELAKRKEN